MRQLLHTLYVTEKDVELHLQGEALEAKRNGECLAHVPLHNLESIVTYAFKPASPALMEACAEKGIDFIVMSQKSSIRFKVIGITHGNPELRLLQYRFADNTERAIDLAKIMIGAKINNCGALLCRHSRNHPELHDALREMADDLGRKAEDAKKADNAEKLRGIEAEAAKLYFSAFSMMIRAKDEAIVFNGRNRRPPTDPANALLSLTYVMLANRCFSALESVGLDPFIGVLHSERSGHAAMAYDLMEELRPAIADRFVLRLLNLNILSSEDFVVEERECRLTSAGLKRYFSEWDNMLNTKVVSDCEKGKLENGLLPYWQAQKLARFLYGKDPVYYPYRMEE